MLPISDDAQKYFKAVDNKRAKQKKHRETKSTERYMKRLSDAMVQSKSGESYAPGLYDASSGPSAEMGPAPIEEPKTDV